MNAGSWEPLDGDQDGDKRNDGCGRREGQFVDFS